MHPDEHVRLTDRETQTLGMLERSLRQGELAREPRRWCTAARVQAYGVIGAALGGALFTAASPWGGRAPGALTPLGVGLVGAGCVAGTDSLRRRAGASRLGRRLRRAR